MGLSPARIGAQPVEEEYLTPSLSALPGKSRWGIGYPGPKSCAVFVPPLCVADE